MFDMNLSVHVGLKTDPLGVQRKSWALLCYESEA